MRSTAGGLKGSVKSDINITPLVDVVLVLLIIFMVVTPLLGDGVDVEMAKTVAPMTIPAPDKDRKPCTIAISYTGDVNAGQLWFNGKQQADMTALDAQLRELHERTPGMKIHIKADRRLNFGGIKKVMKACNNKGFDAVSLITLAQNGDGLAPLSKKGVSS